MEWQKWVITSATIERLEVYTHSEEIHCNTAVKRQICGAFIKRGQNLMAFKATKLIQEHKSKMFIGINKLMFWNK